MYLQLLLFYLWCWSKLGVLGQTWKKYPLTLEGDSFLQFPQVEAAQYQYQGDSWFITAEVIGQTSKKRYQIVTIFSRNYITAAILNIYQTSIFDYETGDFNTFTEYDLPGIALVNMKFHASSDHMDIGFRSSAGESKWRNRMSSDQSLKPFEYNVFCPGIDHTTGSPFAFNISVDMQKKPVAFGGSILRGHFTFYKQRDTITYFQPGPKIEGSLTFKGLTESITGTEGHIDRQIFPLYNGIFTPTGRQNSHEWRQINLDNGIDLAIWRQFFDRLNNNIVEETTGTTTSYKPNEKGNADAPTYQVGLPDDINVEYISYSKFPRANYSTLLPPPSANMYHPSRHIITSKALNMTLEGVYTTQQPVAQLPIEYFEGPMLWNGTYNFKAVQGVGIFETTLSLYRDWELAEVLVNSVAHLPEVSFAAKQYKDDVLLKCHRLQSLTSSNPILNRRLESGKYAKTVVIPALQAITNRTDRTSILEIVEDFISSLGLVL